MSIQEYISIVACNIIIIIRIIIIIIYSNLRGEAHVHLNNASLAISKNTNDK